jgi:predicted small metal-binding protein
MKLLKELVEHDENVHGLVAINSLETYLVRLSIKLLKRLVEHDENFHGLIFNSFIDSLTT